MIDHVKCHTHGIGKYVQEYIKANSVVHLTTAGHHTEWHKKNGNFWKNQQKLKKSKKKNVLTEIEPLKLAF